MKTFALTICAAAALAAGATAATNPAVQLGPDRVVVDPASYRFAVDLRCPPGGAACVGLLGVETAAPIKPYAGRPAQKWDVGAFAFAVPAGKTKPTAGRVYGAALAELFRSGSVKVRVNARITTTGEVAAKRVLTLVLKRR